MKWFEVRVIAVKTYAVQAQDEDDALDWATDECGDYFDEMYAVELKTEEEIARSKRHADEVFYGG